MLSIPLFQSLGLVLVAVIYVRHTIIKMHRQLAVQLAEHALALAKIERLERRARREDRVDEQLVEVAISRTPTPGSMEPPAPLPRARVVKARGFHVLKGGAE